VRFLPKSVYVFLTRAACPLRVVSHPSRPDLSLPLLEGQETSVAQSGFRRPRGGRHPVELGADVQVRIVEERPVRVHTGEAARDGAVAGETLSTPAVVQPPGAQPRLSWRVRMRVLRAALGLILLAALAAVPAHAVTRRVPVRFYGVVWDGEVASAPLADQEAEWGRMAQSGAETARLVFSWAAAQPSPDRSPDFRITDTLVARAAAHGIRLLPVVIYAPRWARLFPDRDNSPPKDVRGYVAYLRALVGRYGPDGSFWAEHPDLTRSPLREWQVWNEPQLRFQWNGRDENGDGVPDHFERDYGALLRASYRTLKRADPGSTVVLAGTTNDAWRVLDRLYDKGDIGGYFDVAAVHPFTGSPKRLVRVLRLFRRTLRRHRDRRTPIWVTEFGWPASKGRTRVERYQRTIQTTDGGMASRLRRAYRLLARDRRRLGVRRAYWYTWASSYEPGNGMFRFAGLRRFDGARFRSTPALRAYRASARRHEGCKKTKMGTCR
jgi:hypothetical protein